MRRTAAAIVLALASGCASQPGDRAPVPRPEVKAGERWGYRTMNYLTNAPGELYEVQVTFANRDVIQGLVTWKAEPPEADVTWTGDWNAVVSATEGMGLFDRVGVFDPHFGLFKFPLEVGSSWKSAYELRLPRRNDLRVRHDRTISVVGYEDVVVPAGRFRALKVVAEGTYRHLGFSNATGTTRTVAWYVPQVKRWVKVAHEEFLNIAGNWRTRGAPPLPRPMVAREDELVFFEVQ